MPFIADPPIIRTNDMARLLDCSEALLEAEPRLLAITVRVMTSRYSYAGPTPDFDDDVDVRGLDPVDVIYHLTGSPANELYEPGSAKAAAAAFFVERERGYFSRAIYEGRPTIFGGQAFVTLIGRKASGAIPGLHSLHLHRLDPVRSLRYLPILASDASQHQRLAAAKAFAALARKVSDNS